MSAAIDRPWVLCPTFCRDEDASKTEEAALDPEMVPDDASSEGSAELEGVSWEAGDSGTTSTREQVPPEHDVDHRPAAGQQTGVADISNALQGLRLDGAPASQQADNSMPGTHTQSEREPGTGSVSNADATDDARQNAAAGTPRASAPAGDPSSRTEGAASASMSGQPRRRPYPLARPAASNAGELRSVSVVLRPAGDQGERAHAPMQYEWLAVPAGARAPADDLEGDGAVVVTAMHKWHVWTAVELLKKGGAMTFSQHLKLHCAARTHQDEVLSGKPLVWSSAPILPCVHVLRPGPCLNLMSGSLLMWLHQTC